MTLLSNIQIPSRVNYRKISDSAWQVSVVGVIFDETATHSPLDLHNSHVSLMRRVISSLVSLLLRKWNRKSISILLSSVIILHKTRTFMLLVSVE